MRECELRQKEVINARDCKVLGCVADVEIDMVSGKVLALIIPGPGKLCGMFGRDMEYVIPFSCICQVGEDIILVDVKIEEIYVKCKC